MQEGRLALSFDDDGDDYYEDYNDGDDGDAVDDDDTDGYYLSDTWWSMQCIVCMKISLDKVNTNQKSKHNSF